MYRILPVESEHGGMQPLLQCLAAQGYELLDGRVGAMASTGVPDAAQALVSCVQTLQPDLVLLDTALPADTLFQGCHLLKNDALTDVIPVIFVHGQSASPNGVVVKSFECGATDFISLQIPDDEQLARIQAAIRDKRAVTHCQALAGQLNQMNTELYERNVQVERELYIARQLQQSLLPPFLPDETDAQGLAASGMKFSKCHYQDERLRITGVYMPCDALGGDIYDVIRFPNDTVGVAIADVSGHGVPAGFVTAIFKAAFYRITHSYSEPGDILAQLNNELADIVKTGEYVTAVYCRIRISDDGKNALVMDYSGAGHPYPFYCQAETGSVQRLEKNGTPLVWVKDMEYPLGSVTLASGDKVLLFTDGISEMRNAHGAMYGEEALEETIRQLVGDGQVDILDRLIQILSDFTEGHPLEDDLSVVLIEAL